VSPVTREALNPESGLTDGICVPVVVILLGLAVGTQVGSGTIGHVVWVVIEEIGIGLTVGLALTWFTILMLRFAERHSWISENWVEIPIVALAAACFAGRKRRAAAGSLRALSAGSC
jgi:sodium/hydrogen antiporter